MAPLRLAASVTLLATAACSTAPSPALPPPDVCFQRCAVNACTLSPEYEGKGDEARAVDELLCTRMNSDAARYCDELNRQCAAELRRRLPVGSTGR